MKSNRAFRTTRGELRKKAFAPGLLYFVHLEGMFMSPKVPGLRCGQKVWMDADLQFPSYRAAKEFAGTKYGAEVLKVRVSAVPEEICGTPEPAPHVDKKGVVIGYTDNRKKIKVLIDGATLPSRFHPDREAHVLEEA